MERWKEVKGFEGMYEVSSFGQVRNVERIIQRKSGRPTTMKSKVLTPESLKDGSLKVKLVEESGLKKRFTIHWLVAENFIPRESICNKVIHIDGNVLNNSVDNLKWISQELKMSNKETQRRKDTNKGFELPDIEKVSEWRDIAKYEGLYEASDLGHVRSKDRVVQDVRTGTQRVKGRVLKQEFNFSARVVLTDNTGKKSKHMVHKVIYDTFIGTVKESEKISFIDGNKKNCSMGNLHIGTIKREPSESVNKAPKKDTRIIEGEIWKQFRDSSYQVSSSGRVIGASGDVLSLNLSGAYPSITLSNKGKRQSFRIHRLVAELFIPNIYNKPVVNHINGVKYDNRVENLEWVTYSENTLHAHENKLKGSRTIINELKDDVKKFLTPEQIESIFNKYNI